MYFYRQVCIVTLINQVLQSRGVLDGFQRIMDNMSTLIRTDENELRVLILIKAFTFSMVISPSTVQAIAQFCSKLYPQNKETALLT